MQSAKIAITDRDVSGRKKMCTKLTTLGHRVVAETAGIDALLSYLTSNSDSLPDMVFLDETTAMKEWESFRKFKREYPDLKVVVLYE